MASPSNIVLTQHATSGPYRNRFAPQISSVGADMRKRKEKSDSLFLWRKICEDSPTDFTARQTVSLRATPRALAPVAAAGLRSRSQVAELFTEIRND
ncbi:hypothetical protein [Noviherbaspirillum pedocola]|uniref:Uncharacterized protein n=1 Tax=Noviherbaspirillum pedocola TaxID=2801341 RepID=A0A934SV53_9BURK|nr:hypothetical protein [Noviherbaspirillum pedocola]MBK4736159.1 hypothetical protein [Noviherbaspirillum pedocola]